MKKFLSIFTLITAILSISNPFQAEAKNMENTKKLVVYFSKTGEQYSVGNITEGNTAIIAKMIAEQTKADLFEVKLKNDTYPAAYKALTEVALAEKKAAARPEIVDDVADFAGYDVVFIGTPNWWADMPMAMYSFIEAHDWKGKTVIPFVTHEGSGLSSIPSKIKNATGAEMADGFEIYGHVAQNDREQAKEEVVNWLKKLGF
ncbi:MAG: NAD(P)H-dependent oxidoreductase [Alphaproteobacteria bacterium]|nr:NAD(P)H-dependent oxidoreductase [Alphaproteobacteria bacterium]